VNRIEFTGADGSPFWGLQWVPPDPAAARGIVVALHGMGSAAGEFAPLGEFLSARGWVVVAPNQRGNGHDPVVERRGHGFAYSSYRRDVLAFLQAARAGREDLPLFLLGESMGGLLSVCYLTDAEFTATCSDCRGVILCAPVFELRRPTPLLVRRLLRLIAWCFPRWVIPPSLFIHGKTAPVPLTRDSVYQEYTLTAPHRVWRFTVSFTAGVDRLMECSRQKAGLLRTPLLVLGGEDDIFISPQQLRTWFAQAGSPDKTLQVFNGSKHLLLHELNTLEVLEKIESWIELRRSRTADGKQTLAG
jgi:acylglycerol lipase